MTSALTKMYIFYSRPRGKYQKMCPEVTVEEGSGICSFAVSFSISKPVLVQKRWRVPSACLKHTHLTLQKMNMEFKNISESF